MRTCTTVTSTEQHHQLQLQAEPEVRRFLVDQSTAAEEVAGASRSLDLSHHDDHASTPMASINGSSSSNSTATTSDSEFMDLQLDRELPIIAAQLQRQVERSVSACVDHEMQVLAQSSCDDHREFEPSSTTLRMPACAASPTAAHNRPSGGTVVEQDGRAAPEAAAVPNPSFCSSFRTVAQNSDVYSHRPNGKFEPRPPPLQWPLGEPFLPAMDVGNRLSLPRPEPTAFDRDGSPCDHPQDCDKTNGVRRARDQESPTHSRTDERMDILNCGTGETDHEPKSEIDPHAALGDHEFVLFSGPDCDKVEDSTGIGYSGARGTHGSAQPQDPDFAPLDLVGVVSDLEDVDRLQLLHDRDSCSDSSTSSTPEPTPEPSESIATSSARLTSLKGKLLRPLPRRSTTRAHVRHSGSCSGRRPRVRSPDAAAPRDQTHFDRDAFSGTDVQILII